MYSQELQCALQPSFRRALLEQQDFKAALPYFSKGLAIEEKALGPKHPNTADTLARIGETYLQMGQPDNAVAPLERAWGIQADRAAPPPEVASVAFALARALTGTHSTAPDRAVTLARRARELAATAADGESKTATLAEIDDWLSAHARHR